MSFFQIPIVNPVSKRVALTGNTPTVIVEATNGNITIAHIHIANVHSGAVTATVDVFDSAAAVELCHATSLAAGAYVDMEGVVLNQGDSLRVTSNNASGLLHVTVHHTVANPVR